MKSRYAALAVAGTLILGACGDTPEPTGLSLRQSHGTASSTQGDSYLVLFKGKGVPADFATNVAELGGSVIFAHAKVGVAAVSGLSSASANQLSARSDVAAVEVDAFTSIDVPGEFVTEATDVSSPGDPSTATRFARQWHLRAIHADAAWAAGKLGDAGVRVGILDTGLGYTHPDLAGRVDLANSVSFVPADDALVAAYFPGAHPIADLHYHGTHVGATVASNALAAAGVTSQTTLVGVKVCSVLTGRCPTSGVLAGILYATDLGLPIINMSLGGSFTRQEASAAGGLSPSFLAIINSVFNYANSNGTVVVVSAGNSAIDMDHNGNQYNSYCNAPHVVCVSATGPTAQVTVDGPWTDIDALAGYSNYGRSAISVAAPGGNASAVWAACSSFSLVIPICQTGTFIVGLGGTSMAAPHTSGVAALIAAEGVAGASRIRSGIEASADDLGQRGTDPAYGKGRINAARAVGLN